MSYPDFDPDFNDYGPVNHIQEAVREWTYIVGAENPDRPWILSDWDTWEKNPFYKGPPVDHPEYH
jgi:hypothetical protein